MSEADNTKYPETPTEPDGPKPKAETTVGFAADLAGGAPPGKKPAEAKKPEEKPKPDESKTWDKERQHRDEIRASQKREQTLEGDLTDTRSQLEDAQAQLDELKARKEAGEEVELQEFDDVAKAVKNLLGQVGGLEKSIKHSLTEQDKRIKNVEQTAATAQVTANKEAGQRALDNACKPLAVRYGVKHQNGAVEKTQTDYERLGIADLKPPARSAWVMENLERNFKELREADGDTSDVNAGFDPPNVDASAGGSPVSIGGAIKEGSLDDVAAQYQQVHSTKKKR